MHKQWNIISRDFPGLERNPGIKIPVKMTRDPGTEPLVQTVNNNSTMYFNITPQRGADDLHR